MSEQIGVVLIFVGLGLLLAGLAALAFRGLAGADRGGEPRGRAHRLGSR